MLLRTQSSVKGRSRRTEGHVKGINQSKSLDFRQTRELRNLETGDEDILFNESSQYSSFVEARMRDRLLLPLFICLFLTFIRRDCKCATFMASLLTSSCEKYKQNVTSSSGYHKTKDDNSLLHKSLHCFMHRAFSLTDYRRVQEVVPPRNQSEGNVNFRSFLAIPESNSPRK